MNAGPPSTEVLRAAAASLPRLPRLADDPGGPLLVGVSGGADSVYLLLALSADEAFAGRLVVAHFDHRTRGRASAADAEFVAALCASLGVPCRLVSFPRQIHGFVLMGGVLDEAHDAVALCADGLRRAFA